MVKNTKTPELGIILGALPKENLMALKNIFDNTETMRGLIGILNLLVLNDKEKIVGLSSGIETVDQAVKIVSKQNFYSGSIRMAVLLHGLLKHAPEEMERRERKDK